MGSGTKILMGIKSTPPKILLVKLYSLGDVLHNLPIVWDLRGRLPEAQIDWVVEEGYVHLLQPLLSTGGFEALIASFLSRCAGGRKAFSNCKRGKNSLLSKKSFKQFPMM